MGKKLGAEFIGTAWLVFGGCGSAVIAAAFPQLGIGFLGVSLAFGLTVLTMVYAFGHISGGHFNPAVSIGLWAGGRFAAKEICPYIVAQVVGAIVAAGASLPHRQRQGRLRRGRRRLRVQRLRRPLARAATPWRRPRRRGRADLLSSCSSSSAPPTSGRRRVSPGSPSACA